MRFLLSLNLLKRLMVARHRVTIPKRALAMARPLPEPETTTTEPFVFEDSNNQSLVSMAQLTALMQIRNVSLIDVRDSEQVDEQGKIPGAVRIPLGQLEESLATDSFVARYRIPKPQEMNGSNIVFYCQSTTSGDAFDSKEAVEVAKRLGYVNARYYAGGWTEWRKVRKMGQVLPSE